MITYLDAIRSALARALADDPRVFLYGQDIGAFGGAFKATKNLAKEFPGRVLDAPLSEDAIVGIAIGAAIEGMRPIVEMQFADFSTCGFNQIVNHAATLFYRTEVPCPIVVRLPSGGTPGSGPFHSQSMEALYAYYPGLVVMTPGTVEDAYSMLIEAVAIDETYRLVVPSLARRVSLIALYGNEGAPGDAPLGELFITFISAAGNAIAYIDAMSAREALFGLGLPIPNGTREVGLSNRSDDASVRLGAVWHLGV